MSSSTASAAGESPSRAYAAALEKLNLLASNRAITTLFEKPAQAAKSPSPSPSKDLNAQAIPEMLEWLRKAGYAPRDLAAMRHIHVAGTKGKGSVCAFATSLLRHEHRRRREEGNQTTAAPPVGTYMSPHLVSPRERIAIDGEPVSQAVFTAAFDELWGRFTASALAEGQTAEVAEGPLSKPFYFRFLTILAWHIFLRAGVRDVVMECGIGGEYDATNVLPPEAVSAAVVTQLGIDHVAMLGDTVEKIAWHKAGIFKPGVTALTLGLQAEQGVMEVLRQRAAEKGTALLEVDEQAVDSWGGVDSTLRGAFQKRNQALAVFAVQQHLGVRDASLSTAKALAQLPESMVAGLSEAKLRGRCEVIHDDEHGVEWMLDGAHTKESIQEVARWLAQSVTEGEKAVLVFNQQERDAPKLLAHLVETVAAERGSDVFSHALFTRNEQAPAEHNGDLSVQNAVAETMKAMVPSCKIQVFDNVQSTVAEARKTASGSDSKQKVLVTGSLHLVGGIMRAVEPDSLL